MVFLWLETARSKMAPRSACATAMSYAERLSGKGVDVTEDDDIVRVHALPPAIHPGAVGDSVRGFLLQQHVQGGKKPRELFCRMTLGMLSQYMV